MDIRVKRRLYCIDNIVSWTFENVYRFDKPVNIKYDWPTYKGSIVESIIFNFGFKLSLDKVNSNNWFHEKGLLREYVSEKYDDLIKEHFDKTEKYKLEHNGN